VERLAGDTDAVTRTNGVIEWTDVNHTRAVLLAEIPYSRNRFAVTYFDYDRSSHRSNAAFKPGHLTGYARLDPVSITEHQNVEARHSTALPTPGRQQTAIRFVDLYA
jgi:hypothetical protein